MIAILGLGASPGLTNILARMAMLELDDVTKVRWMENKIINEILINSFKSLSYVVKKYFKKDKLNT